MRASFKSFERVEYESNPPTLKFSRAAQALLAQETLAELKHSSLLKYHQSKLALEESIAEVCSQDERGLRSLRLLAQRYIDIIDAVHDLDIDGWRAQFGRTVATTDTGELGHPTFLLELSRGCFLSQILSSTLKSDESGVEKGKLTSNGNVGMSFLAIRNIPKDGNIREILHIIFNLSPLIDRVMENPDNVLRVNTALAGKTLPWQIDITKLDHLRANAPAGTGLIMSPGGSALGIGGRAARDARERKIYRPVRSRYSLSERERLANPKGQSDQMLWLSGESFWVIPHDSNTPFIRAAKQSQEILLCDVSCTTDRVLTAAHVFGVIGYDGITQTDILVSYLGNATQNRHHSSHEVLTAAISFGLPYSPSPTSYKRIREGDATFIGKIRTAQERRGALLPDMVLSSALKEEVCTFLQEHFLRQLSLGKQTIISKHFHTLSEPEQIQHIRDRMASILKTESNPKVSRTILQTITMASSQLNPNEKELLARSLHTFGKYIRPLLSSRAEILNSLQDQEFQELSEILCTSITHAIQSRSKQLITSLALG